MLGLFWKKTTNNAAIWGALLSIPVALYFKVGPNAWAEGTSIEGLFVSLPFMHQMGLTFLITVGMMLLISYMEGKGKDNSKGIILSKTLFKTSPVFNIGAFVVMIILAALYGIFW